MSMLADLKEEPEEGMREQNQSPVHEAIQTSLIQPGIDANVGTEIIKPQVMQTQTEKPTSRNTMMQTSPQ